MKYVLNFRKGDQKIINSYIFSLAHTKSDELIALYNLEVSTGITGVHKQALFLYALDQVFKKRFGRSRIFRQDNTIDLKWKAELVNGKVRFRLKKTRQQLCQEKGAHELKMEAQPRIYYTRGKKIKISFLSLIIRVNSISKYYNGDLNDFAGQHDLFGVSNKRLFIRSEMSGHLPSETDRIVNEVLIPLGFKDRLDYVIVQEQHITIVNGYDEQLLNKPIPDCEGISWLDSEILKHGHFIWFRSEYRSSE